MTMKKTINNKFKYNKKIKKILNKTNNNNKMRFQK